MRLVVGPGAGMPGRAHALLATSRLLQTLALAMLVGSLSSPFGDAVDRLSPLYINQLSIPVVFFIAACAADLQRTAPSQSTANLARARKRSFSALPYLAVAAVDALLMTSLWSGDDDAVVVGAGGFHFARPLPAEEFAAMIPSNGNAVIFEAAGDGCVYSPRPWLR